VVGIGLSSQRGTGEGLRGEKGGDRGRGKKRGLSSDLTLKKQKKDAQTIAQRVKRKRS